MEPQKYNFSLSRQDAYKEFVVYRNIFSEEECAAIRQIGLSLPVAKAKILNKDGELVEKAETRVSRVRRMGWNPETDWLYRKLESVLLACNKETYQFDISGFYERIQFTEYETGGHYNWHVDLDKGQYSMRKLSMIVQLSAPEEYEGGEVQFTAYGMPRVPKGLGTVAIFPAYVWHRVCPVTKGQRFSLVVWSSGPHFR